MNLLYLSAFVPYPVTDGDKVRAFWTLRALARKHRVFGFFLDPEGTRRPKALPGPVAGLCADARVVALPPSARAAGALLGALRGLPVHAYAFWNPRLQAELDRALSRWPVEGIHVHRIRMMPYASRTGLPYVLDATDSIAHYYRGAAGLGVWRRAYARLDRKRVERCEVTWGNGAEAVLAITEEERRHLRGIGITKPVLVAPNGLDPAYWRRSRGRRDPGLIVFVGNLGYPPNTQGLEWFAASVAPGIAARVPAARLVVAGGGASGALRASVSRSPLPVRFAGYLPDLRPLLGRASVVVCPLRLAAGLQNKAIQAMACATPTVMTSGVARAIGLRRGVEAAVADGASGFAAATVRVLGNPRAARRMGERGRRLVAARFADPLARRNIDRAAALLARAIGAEDRRWS